MTNMKRQRDSIQVRVIAQCRRAIVRIWRRKFAATLLAPRALLSSVAVLSFAMGLAIFAPDDAIAASSPIAAYSFDETSGVTLADRSGNKHAGTLRRGPAWTAGKYNGGLFFDGVNDYVTMGDVAQADSLTSFTVSAWVRFSVNGGGAYETHLVDKSGCNGYTNGGPWELGVSLTSSHKAEFLIYVQGGSPVPYIFSGASTTSVDDASWHFVTGRYDGDRLSVWVDGVQENSVAAPGVTMPNSYNRFELGGYCNGYPYRFRGTLDDVRIYDRALTQAEIKEDMATPIGGTPPPDSTAPSVAITTPANGATVSGMISVAASAADNVGVDRVQFLLNDVALGAADSSAPYAVSWNTTLSANGTHTVTAVARDVAGNTKVSTPISLVVSNSAPPPIDVTPPTVPTGLVPGTVSTSSIAITWTASSDSVGVSGYRIFRNASQVGTSTTVSFNDTGLSASTNYAYTVSAFDAAGNTSANSASLVVATAALPLPDTAPPSVPTGLGSSGITGTQVTISWQASTDNVGIAGYSIFRNSTQIGTRTTTSFTDNGLTPNTTYFYTVSAYDAAGNNSLESTALTVNTAASTGGSYSTNFDLTENPISEGGVWHRANNSWTSVRTQNGMAHGTNGITNEYDDSYALLSGFGPTQTAEAVVFRSPSLVTGISHEVELLLRFSDDSGNARGYECLFAYYGGVEVVRWNGAMGNYTPLSFSGGSGSLGREFITGDVVKATIAGNVISLYINGLLIGRATDSVYTTGQPGISFFTRPGGNSAHFALMNYTVTSD